LVFLLPIPQLTYNRRKNEIPCTATGTGTKKKPRDVIVFVSIFKLDRPNMFRLSLIKHLLTYVIVSTCQLHVCMNFIYLKYPTILYICFRSTNFHGFHHRRVLKVLTLNKNALLIGKLIGLSLGIFNGYLIFILQ
ncbi:hypothetical protein ACJX0J_006835, partial [Zea mays]